MNFVGMEDLATQAVEAFLQQQAALMGGIDRAISAKDAKALELAAHTYKGAVSNFCAEPTRSRAEALEGQGRRGSMDQVVATQAELKEEYRKLELELRAFVKERKTA